MSENAGPVDTVNGTKAVGGVDVRIGEEGLDDVLAVVEGSLDSQVVHVGVKHGSHLLLLNGRHLSIGEENEDTGVLLTAKTVDGSGTSVAGGGTNNCKVVAVLTDLTLVLALQEVFEQVSEELESNTIVNQFTGLSSFDI